MYILLAHFVYSVATLNYVEFLQLISFSLAQQFVMLSF